MSDHLLFAPLYDQQEEDAIAEERDEEIGYRASMIATVLMADPKWRAKAFAELDWGAVMSEAAVNSVMDEVFCFAARYEAAGDDNERMAEAGYPLWRMLKPYLQELADAQALIDATREIDEEVQRSRDDADEHRAEAA